MVRRAVIGFFFFFFFFVGVPPSGGSEEGDTRRRYGFGVGAEPAGEPAAYFDVVQERVHFPWSDSDGRAPLPRYG